MNERITLIIPLSNENINKIITKIKKKDKQLCKVPFGKNTDDRYNANTLPYHLTIFSWSIKKEKEVIDLLDFKEFSKFKIIINKIEVMSGNENSYVLYFSITDSKELKKIQTKIYNYYHSEYYKPKDFNFHITIHIDKNYNNILKLKTKIEKEFDPFELEINTLELYEIYPANLIKKYILS